MRCLGSTKVIELFPTLKLLIQIHIIVNCPILGNYQS